MKQEQFKRTFIGFDRAQVAEYLLEQNADYVRREDALSEQLKETLETLAQQSKAVEDLTAWNAALERENQQLREQNESLTGRLEGITAQFIELKKTGEQNTDAAELLEALAKYIKSVDLPKGKLIDLA